MVKKKSEKEEEEDDEKEDEEEDNNDKRGERCGGARLVMLKENLIGTGKCGLESQTWREHYRENEIIVKAVIITTRKYSYQSVVKNVGRYRSALPPLPFFPFRCSLILAPPPLPTFTFLPLLSLPPRPLPILPSLPLFTTKGSSCRLEKKKEVWMKMMIAAILMWVGAAEKPDQSKMTFKNHQNDPKQLTQLPIQTSSK